VHERPQRPFVPHSTLNASRHQGSQSEFRLSRPFVPGSAREDAAEVRVNARADASGTQHEGREQLPAIDTFLETEEADAVPIEHFLDPLPPVVSFAPDADGALIGESEASVKSTSGAAATRTASETEWVEDDWQQYDWRAAAALAEGANAAASNDWEATDWDIGAPAPHDAKPTAAQAIARALDQIARKIRQGEVTVPAPGALTDPAAIAATLAALLGVRR